jgi:hypothetical protein
MIDVLPTMESPIKMTLNCFAEIVPLLGPEDDA